MTKNLTACCNNPFIVKDVQEFLADERTLSSLNCFNYWNNLNPTLDRNIQICAQEFTGAYKVLANSKTAYAFLGKSQGGPPISCQSVFTNWNDRRL